MKMLIFILSLLFPAFLFSQNNGEKIIYLIPGQGSDSRLFKNICIENYRTQYVKYNTPEKGETMEGYAKQLSDQIDTTQKYSIIGVSLGGMLAMEMSKFMDPEEIILIASAKTKNEIPNLYKFFRKIPIHRLLGGNFYKYCTIILQPLYEPMAKEDRKLWQSMMKQKDPKFMKRAVRCIVEWDYENYGEINLLHIHGEKDKTLPIKNIENPVVIEGGTHVMTLTNGKEISEIINSWLADDKSF